MSEKLTTERHPDLMELEAARTGEATVAVRDHVKACPRCQEIIAELDMLAVDARVNRPAVMGTPSRADEAVFSVIEQRSQEIRWRYPKRRRFLTRPVWAAAAAIAVAVLTWSVLSPHRAMLPTIVKSVSYAGDVDRDGAVDIVDAYLMALRLESGIKTPENWDLNKDGAVDKQDIAVVTLAAVAVVEEA